MSEIQEIRWKTKTETDSGSIIRIGGWSVGLLMVLFVIWGSTFPLSSAVITPGTVVSEGRNKLIQHSSGGQVLEIKVREGDFLEKGQIVLTLDPTQARADLSRLDARHASLSALKARLDAERSGGERLMPGPKPSFKEFKLRGVPSQPVTPLKLGLRNGEGGVVFLAETVKPLLPVTTPLIDPIVTASVPDELMDSQRAAGV